MTIKFPAVSTATTADTTMPIPEHKRRLFVTLAFHKDSNAVIAVMVNIGARSAIDRTHGLRRALTSKLGFMPKMEVKRYCSFDHDFLLGLAHLRVGKPEVLRQRDRDYRKVLRESRRILIGV